MKKNETMQLSRRSPHCQTNAATPATGRSQSDRPCSRAPGRQSSSSSVLHWHFIGGGKSSRQFLFLLLITSVAILMLTLLYAFGMMDRAVPFSTTGAVHHKSLPISSIKRQQSNFSNNEYDSTMQATVDGYQLVKSSVMMQQGRKSGPTYSSAIQEEGDAVDFYIAFPPGGASSTRSHVAVVEGILFVAHGCSHSAWDWFPIAANNCSSKADHDPNDHTTSEKPTLCHGLPEERAIVKEMVMEQQWMVVAISSKNRHSKCWDSTTDSPRVATVLQHIKQTYIAPSDGSSPPSSPIPFVAFGASSGGAFVSNELFERHVQQALASGTYSAQPPPIQYLGFLSQIMALYPPSSKVTCVIYITMPLDGRTERRASDIVRDWASTTTASTTAVVKHMRLPRTPVHPSTFADRIPELSLETSEVLYEILMDKKWLDQEEAGANSDVKKTGHDWFLAINPRSQPEEWRAWFRPVLSSAAQSNSYDYADSLIADESPLSEVMNALYGQHELTRDGVQSHRHLHIFQEKNNLGELEVPSNFSSLALATLPPNKKIYQELTPSQVLVSGLKIIA